MLFGYVSPRGPRRTTGYGTNASPVKRTSSDEGAWDERIARAAELATTTPLPRSSSFYRELVRYQQPVFEELRARHETDIRTLLRYFPDCSRLVRRAGPEPLATLAGASSVGGCTARVAARIVGSSGG